MLCGIAKGIPVAVQPVEGTVPTMPCGIALTMWPVEGTFPTMLCGIARWLVEGTLRSAALRCAATGALFAQALGSGVACAHAISRLCGATESAPMRQ